MEARDGEPYEVYVDESGDRGWGPRTSPVFVLSAVVISRRDEPMLRDMLNKINIELRRPPTGVLHWCDNLRDHSIRKYVSRELRDLPAKYINVILCKESLADFDTEIKRPDCQYRYAVVRLIERVSWCVASTGSARLHFAHVRRFKYEMLHDYLDRLRNQGGCSINWGALTNGTRPLIEQPSQMRSLQVADMVAGSVFAALRPDRYGSYEPAYLKTIAPRLWRGQAGELEKHGLDFICGSDHDCRSHFPWWPELEAASTVLNNEPHEGAGPTTAACWTGVT